MLYVIVDQSGRYQIKKGLKSISYREHILLVSCVSSRRYTGLKSHFYFLIIMCSITQITYCLIFFTHENGATFTWLLHSARKSGQLEEASFTYLSSR